MKQILFLFMISGILWTMAGCDSDEEHICSSKQVKVLSECIDTARHDFIFIGYPDFYCFNDSVAIGIKDYNYQRNIIYFRVYPYIQDRGIGKNWLIGGATSSGGSSWKFYERCYQSPEDNSQYHTFLFVLDGDKITEDTKEIHCRLELRDGIYTDEYDPEIITPSAILDTSTVVLKRLFY